MQLQQRDSNVTQDQTGPFNLIRGRCNLVWRLKWSPFTRTSPQCQLRVAMSSQRGNAQRTRAQKHKNTHAFKNTMHDTSQRTKEIVAIQAVGCCARCKDIIDWKIKYKKYKPLTVVKKCVGCQEKRIKRAYYTLCDDCIQSTGKCGKCGEKKKQLLDLTVSTAEANANRTQLEYELKMLPERKRRTFQRLQESGQLSSLPAEGARRDEDDEDDACSEDDEDCCGDTAAGGEDVDSEGDDGGAAVGSSLAKLVVIETSDKKVHFSDEEEAKEIT